MSEQQVEEREVQMVEVKQDDVDKMIRHHVWGAMGVGLIPLPLLDYVAFTGIQLDMLRKLAKMYEIPFLKDKVRNIVTPLIGASMPGVLGVPVALSLIKIVPGLGQIIGTVTVPILAGATTYAIGKVFNQHFASGGTFLTFDPEKVKTHYAEMFEEGKKVAAEAKS